MRTLPALLLLLAPVAAGDALIDLDSVDGLRRRFDAGKERPRLVAIVSPG